MIPKIKKFPYFRQSYSYEHLTFFKSTGRDSLAEHDVLPC